MDLLRSSTTSSSPTALAVLAFLLALLPQWLDTEKLNFSSAFIVWNVGQGQWTTEISPQECRHFDMGGEHNPLLSVSRLCRNKKQSLFLSHWDWDHVGFVQKYSRMHSKLCLAIAPVGPSSPRKQNLLKNLKPCPLSESIFHLGQQKKLSNDQSHIFMSSSILIPGDSTTKMEKLWARNLPSKIHGLVLGHHGSRSSTGPFLLQHLPQLKWAVSSSRFQRYHHPHSQVIQRLQNYHIALLRTEDWGSLVFLRP